jgi:hypothetical protein
MSYVVEIASYDQIWPARFVQMGGELRDALGKRRGRREGIFTCAAPAVGRNDSRSCSETTCAHTRRRHGAMRPSNISWPPDTKKIGTAIRTRKLLSSGRSWQRRIGGVRRSAVSPVLPTLKDAHPDSSQRHAMFESLVDSDGINIMKEAGELRWILKK